MGTELNTYNKLFAPLPQRAPSLPPQGGANWDTGLGSLGASTVTQPTYAPTTYTTSYGAQPARLMGQPQDLANGMASIFQAGVSRDLAGASQARELFSSLGKLNAGQLTTLGNLINQAGTQAEQVFILKAYVAGEPWANIVNYANEMRGRSEAEVIRRSTMRDDADVIQQWQDGCGPTVMQTAAGEADPRYAWELNKGGDITKIAPYGENAALAAQQKQWLEQYGGIAVERGQSGGQGIALSQMLNDLLTPITHASYVTEEVTSAGAGVEAIAQKLNSGLDVPLRISWGQAGTSGDVGHFVLAIAERGTPGARELQIHDPWTGRTAWVSEANIANNSFAPIFNNYARLSHFYAPQATA